MIALTYTWQDVAMTGIVAATTVFGLVIGAWAGRGRR